MLDFSSSPPNISRSVLADHAYTTLHAAILRGDLAPGTPMRETELAARLGVSRTPVREAMRRLFLEGFLTRTPTGNAIVSEVTPALISQAFDLRKLLEGYAARRAANVATPEDLTHMQSIIEEAERAMQAGEWEQLSAHNDRFHGYIERLADNALLTRTTRALRDQFAPYGAFASGDNVQLARSMQEHRLILAALGGHDAERAEALVVQHLERAMSILLATLADARHDDGRPASGER